MVAASNKTWLLSPDVTVLTVWLGTHVSSPSELGHWGPLGATKKPEGPITEIPQFQLLFLVWQDCCVKMANSAFHPLRVDKWVVSCNQMAATTSQWWRRLANAFEENAGMVCLQCKKTVWSIPERFRGEVHDRALYKSSTFTFFAFYLPFIRILWATGPRCPRLMTVPVDTILRLGITWPSTAVLVARLRFLTLLHVMVGITLLSAEKLQRDNVHHELICYAYDRPARYILSFTSSLGS